MQSNTAHPWQDHLTTGDIVRFRFPVDDTGNPKSRPKRRPCLVLDIRWFNGRKFVELAYGTGSQSGANRGFEVRVNHPDSRARAGLDRPTHFIGVRSIIVSVSHPGFVPANDTDTPIMGRLDKPLMERLEKMKVNRTAYAHCAPSAIRAEHLRDQHRERQSATRGFPMRNRGSRGADPIFHQGVK